MAEYDLYFRAESKESAETMLQVAQSIPGIEHAGTMLVPGSEQPVGESGLFDTARLYLDEHPDTQVMDLLHSEQKPWSKQMHDLSVLVLMAEDALQGTNVTAGYGMHWWYNSFTSYLRFGGALDRGGRKISYEWFKKTALNKFRESCYTYSRQPGAPLYRLSPDILKPTEVRIGIFSRGLAGVRVLQRQLEMSEGVKQIQSRRASVDGIIYDSL